MPTSREHRGSALLPVTLLILASCGKPVEKADGNPPYPVPKVMGGGDVVARIGPVALSATELEHRIQQQSPFVRVQLKDRDQRRKFVEEQVRIELLAQEGWRRGLINDPDIQAQIRKVIVQRVMRDELRKLSDQLKVTETELRQAYRDRNDEFNKPAKIRLSQIVRYTDAAAERAKAKKLLMSIKTEVINQQKKNKHQAFANAARKSSEDEATKRGGGDLQFMTRAQLTERYGEEVAKHMFDEVKVGDLAIADAPNAVVLFKKTGARRAVERSIEMVKPQLRGQMIAEKRAKSFDSFVESLQKKHGVSVDLELVDKLKVVMDQPTKEPEIPLIPDNQPGE